MKYLFKSGPRKKRTYFLNILLLVAGLFFLCAFTVDFWIVPLCASIFGFHVEPGYSVHVSWKNQSVELERLHISNENGDCKIGKLSIFLAKKGTKFFPLDGIRIKNIIFADTYFESADAEENPSSEREKTLQENAALVLNTLDDFSVFGIPIDDVSCLNSGIKMKFNQTPVQIQIRSLQKTGDGISDFRKIDSRFHFTVGDISEMLQADCSFLFSDNRTISSGKRIDWECGQISWKLKDSDNLTCPSYNLKGTFSEIKQNETRFSIQISGNESLAVEPLLLTAKKQAASCNGLLRFKGNLLEVFCQSNGSIADFYQNDIPMDWNLSADAQFRIAHNFSNGQITVDSLDGKLNINTDSLIHFAQNGEVQFQKNDGKTFSFVSKNSSFHIDTADINLTPFGLILPFPCVDNHLAFDTVFDLDSKESRIRGKTELSLKHADSQFPFFAGKLKLETDGISDVSSFRVPESDFQYFRNEQAILNAELTGEYALRSANLHGTVNYFPFLLADEFGYDLTEVISRLNGVSPEDIRQQANGNIDWSLPEMKASWNFESAINGFGFTDGGGKKIPIQLSGNGHIHYDETVNDWSYDGKIRGVSGNDIAIDLSIASADGKQIAGEVSIEQAQQHFIKQCINRYFEDWNVLEKLPVKEINLSCSYLWQATQDFPEINQAKIAFELEKSGTVEISGFHINLNDSVQNVLQNEFSLKLKDVPLQYCNLFIPEDLGCSFITGDIAAELHCSHSAEKDMLHVEGAALARDVSNLLDGYVRNFSRIGISGEMNYDLQHHELMQFPDFTVDFQNTQERPLAFFKGQGTYSCKTGDADFSFSEVRCGNDLLNAIQYDAGDVFAFDEFEAVGRLDYHIRDSYDTHIFDGRFTVKKMLLASSEPEQYRFQPLHGTVDGTFTWSNAEDSLFGDASVDLLTENGEKVVSASFLHNRERGGLPVIHTDALDLAHVYSYFTYNVPANPNSQQDATAYVPPEFSPLSIQMDMSGLYAGKGYQGNLQFILEFSDHRLQIKDAILSGIFPGSGNAVFDFTQYDTQYFIYPHFNNIAIDSIMELCEEFGYDVESDRVTGMLTDIEGSVAGRGFTRQDFSNYLDIVLHVKGSPITYVTVSPNTEKPILLSLIHLPFVLFPRFLDAMPSKVAKKLLRTATGGSLWDAITGDRALYFQNGEMNLTLKNGVISIQNMKLKGNYFDSFQANGTVNFMTDEQMDVEYLLQFGELLIPLYFNGNYKDPSLMEQKTTIQFLLMNTENIVMLLPNLIFSKDENILLESFRSLKELQD